MRAVDIILKKRQGKELTEGEIDFLIQGYTKGDIPDYQMSAFAMAVFFQGMTSQETAYLTNSIINSGETIDLKGIEGIKVDKHSTGGVGDTTTLVLGPLVAACGAPVAKMSGRGLGHTGGTLDKLESIPGFRIDLTKEEFIEKVNKTKIAVMGQTAKLAPADGKLYSLRDVTATVDSIPLIASSIMSKKLAAGADGIVLDVKTGDGAFMKTLEGSFALAQEMVNIGEHLGRETVAFITDMNQPLGNAIGNSLEVIEAIETLKGKGPQDLLDLCIELATQMLLIAKVCKNELEAKELLNEVIANGKALEKFREFIISQDGDPRVIDDYTLLPLAKEQIEVKSTTSGYIGKIDAEGLGTLAMVLGAGRAKKEDKIDYGVGLVINKKVGDYVEQGEIIATMYVNDKEKGEKLVGEVLNKFTISQEKTQPIPLIYGIVTKDGIKKF
ncbi:pyrimidine-nucleoside phosphorylase [Anaerobranca californiensis DSM 14826]|jgi:pyrimidine-nucleoside phosphorylase|uniref:Pyrimidine-nucleoside phosphorylase n=1 Tax=Anaerobranca californiensis DSM 14826 TaxID=1120989 RepID=A0A1M6L394_9FIRM|nr:pyrimidine-nucleoside phosphorylase [Anaerobranca californiensis]SHJ65701.1 pyrimidine-nucleoside phosphorylase [Anaerobranca californiensis DSM 14826]